MQSGGILDAAAAYAARSLCRDTGSPDYQGRGQGSGRIINQKRTNGQISRFGLRMAEFILSRTSAAKPSHFYQNGRFIKAGQPQWPFYQSRWQFYAYGRFINNGRFLKIEDRANGRTGRFINQKRANGMLGCGWPISYCPAQAVYQRPSRAFLELAKRVAALSDWPAAFFFCFLRSSLESSL